MKINWTLKKIELCKNILNLTWNEIEQLLGYSGLKPRISFCKDYGINLVTKHKGAKLTNENLNDLFIPLIDSKIDQIRNDADFEINKLKRLINDLQND